MALQQVQHQLHHRQEELEDILIIGLLVIQQETGHEQLQAYLLEYGLVRLQTPTIVLHPKVLLLQSLQHLFFRGHN